ncbi:hypothetical protein [Saccharothrix variisporea]|uniref:Uncharacterized protein n=1 Tax=Saccharothrix variisporea TaxID=543527 RepID=A0A495X2X2_9PSEU|nr:hypothetical protein [Saccharothrix variisporea]RKT66933.1 hypothetical protein DFJ66_0099 [Saccharothrix variisporea]
MPPRPDVLTRRVTWHRTATRVFVLAARVDDTWWVLRRNSFPEHPLYTLFVDGAVVGDIDDTTTTSWDLDATARPPLTDDQRAEVLASVRGLGPYGSEVGRPCDGDWCACDALTDEHVRTTG